MTENKSNIVCHECNCVMRRGTKPVAFSYRGRSITVDQPGWYCDGCDEAIYSGKDMGATELAFAEIKAEVDNVLGPQEVRAIRKRLGLSQRRAGELLGGGQRAFQKYEAGAVEVSKPMSNLLRLLNKQPSLLEELTNPTDSSSDSEPEPEEQTFRKHNRKSKLQDQQGQR
ncbi:MAG: type II toxin-antitoxin system MqsA family antitoxin [Myxococcota bacterium]|jgi:HTH-type transcriptional regulator/antitoxin MqsA|nr:type II toxin-antitoxin system MqsA family antitoxin [Myxococcota bacterium]